MKIYTFNNGLIAALWTWVTATGFVTNNAIPQTASTVFREYRGVFTEGPDGMLHADNYNIRFTKDRIYYEKGGERKYWNVQDLGDVVHRDSGASFKFRKFRLTSANVNVYISYHKMITYKGVEYYLMINDGTKMYVL